MKKYLIIILLLVLTTAFAQNAYETVITVLYDNIKVYKDGKEVELKDVNGKAAEPFIYSDTTYVPIRAVSELLGNSVSWDEETKSIYISDKENFFPDNVFEDNNDSNYLYTGFLKKMNEERLFESDDNFSKYNIRLLCIEGEKTLISCISAIFKDDFGYAYYKKCDEFMEITDDEKYKLTAADVEKLSKLLYESELNSIETLQKTLDDNGNEVMGNDGTTWIIEISDTTNDYHVVERWSPDKDTDVYNLGTFLFELCAEHK